MYLLRDIVDGKTSWEEAFASMRIRMYRSPNVYDTAFMLALRYPPAVCNKYVEQTKKNSGGGGNGGIKCKSSIKGTPKEGNMEMIELPGLPPGTMIQRYCPHQGADLKYATVVNGVITCHRHGWQFCAESGKCLRGGNTNLTLKKLEW